MKSRRHEAPPAARASGTDPITRQNIHSILSLEEAVHHRKPPAYRAVEAIAQYCGTLTFLLINIAIFTIWVMVNEFFVAFDPYPFTFLIFTVSIEAIVLSVMILISQNISAEANERRHFLNLQMTLLVEQELTALLRLSRHMGNQLGMDPQLLAEVEALSRKTEPRHVLDQILREEYVLKKNHSHSDNPVDPRTQAAG